MCSSGFANAQADEHLFRQHLMLLFYMRHISITVGKNMFQRKKKHLSLYTNIPLSPKSCFEMLSLYCNCVVFCVSRYPVLYCIVFIFVYMLMGHYGFMH